MLCNSVENINILMQYVNKPVYIKGYCWCKKFDGWTVIYDEGKSRFHDVNLMFDYRGKKYPAYGFLPSRYTLFMDSTYNNAFYKTEI